MKSLVAIQPRPKTLVELFEGHPERWNKGYAYRQNGECSFREEATSCCLSGGINIVYFGEKHTEAWKNLQKEIGFDIISFNDSPETSFEDMMAVIKRANV